MEQSTRLLMEVMAQLVCMEEERGELEEEHEEAREEEALDGVRIIGQMVETAAQWYTVVLPIAAILAWTWKYRAEPAAQKQKAAPQAA